MNYCYERLSVSTEQQLSCHVKMIFCYVFVEPVCPGILFDVDLFVAQREIGYIYVRCVFIACSGQFEAYLNAEKG